MRINADLQREHRTLHAFIRAISLASALAWCTAASAQPAPAPQATASCDHGDVATVRTCLNEQLAATEGRLDTVYHTVITSGKLRPAAAAKLSREQGQFAVRRDRTCKARSEQQMPGTAAPEIALDCAIQATEARSRHLQALLQHR